MGDAHVVWVRDFEGTPSGRPGHLTQVHPKIIGQVLRKLPEETGSAANLRDGKALCACLHQEFGLEPGARQCWRLFKSLGLLLRTG